MVLVSLLPIHIRLSAGRTTECQENRIQELGRIIAGYSTLDMPGRGEESRGGEPRFTNKLSATSPYGLYSANQDSPYACYYDFPQLQVSSLLFTPQAEIRPSTAYPDFN